ncbi:MAG TPA: hypothetical protein VNZ86_20000 [Bacteroidia bacterium]|nr:hypothetical protein [Bacteroidia bacterium]
MSPQPILRPRGTPEINKQKFNRKASVFAVCLIIAAFFWSITTLSMEFTSLVRFPVKYINLPKDKIVSNNLPDSLELEVKASGFEIARYRLRQHLDPLILDASNYKPHKGSDYFYLCTNSRMDNLNRQIGKEMKVLNIIPDTIFLNFSRKMSKMVPVIAHVNVSFQKSFLQSDSIVIVPPTVKISGSPVLLEKIKELHTQDVTVSGLDRSYKVRKSVLVGTDFKQLELSTDSVNVFIPVAKFTEGQAEVPLQLLNVPAGVSLKVFPDKIKVTYLVSFESFDKIRPEMFQVGVDYRKLEDGSTKIHVDLLRSPATVRSVSITPDRVEYIVRK